MENNELEKFIKDNAEYFEKYKKINDAVEEEMQEIQDKKNKNPELYDAEYQIKLTNEFISKNPDVDYVELKDKKK